MLAERRRGESWRNNPRASSHYIPASRAKLTMLNTVSKIRGQVKNPGYPQSEGLLGECMIRHGKELGGESNFGEGGRRPGLGREAGGGQAEAWGPRASPHWQAGHFPPELQNLF